MLEQHLWPCAIWCSQWSCMEQWIGSPSQWKNYVLGPLIYTITCKFCGFLPFYVQTHVYLKCIMSFTNLTPFQELQFTLTHVCILLPMTNVERFWKRSRDWLKWRFFVHLMQLHWLKIKHFCFTTYSMRMVRDLWRFFFKKYYIKWWRSLHLVFTKYLEVDCLFQTSSWEQRLHWLHSYIASHESFWLYSYSMLSLAWL